MQFGNSFVSEFQAESGLILAQGDTGNRLEDILIPISNILNKEQELLSFSLARYCGANSRVAFFCEWYFQTTRITQDITLLHQENYLYLASKASSSIRASQLFKELIEFEISNHFIPHQLAFIHQKSQELVGDLLLKFTFLHKYLNSSYLNRFVVNELSNYRFLQSDVLDIDTISSIQTMRSSFVQICLPCLVGFVYDFNREDSVINPKGVKWEALEDIFKSIASLHQTAVDVDFRKLMFESKLNSINRIEWLDLSETEKAEKSLQNIENMSDIKSIRDKVYQNTLPKLEQLIFPEKYKNMIKDLIDWAYNL